MNLKKIKLQTYFEIVIHLFVWIFPPVAGLMDNDGVVFIGLANSMDGSVYIALVFGWFFNACIFYSNALWLAPKYLSKAKYYKYVIWLSIIFFGVSGIEYLFDLLIEHIYKLDESVFEGISHVRKFSDGPALLINLILIPFSLLYRFSRDWVKNEFIKRKLTEEKLATELKFLKSQVNPHFLFNTLNNLYGMALRQKVPEMAENINKLSAIMRYMLYESNADLVPLEKEIEYIQNFIEIQQLRFAKEDNIETTFSIEGQIESIKIAPMLLIPFVENAFKHGIDLQKKSYIMIQLKVNNETIEFHVKNSNYKLDQMKRKDESGIGLENVKRRLSLLYPNNHSLNVKEEDDSFEIGLRINEKLKIKSVE